VTWKTKCQFNDSLGVNSIKPTCQVYESPIKHAVLSRCTVGRIEGILINDHLNAISLVRATLTFYQKVCCTIS